MNWPTLVVAALMAGAGFVMLRPPARLLEANFTLYRRLWDWLINVDETQYYSWCVVSGIVALVTSAALIVWFAVDAISRR